MHRTPDDSSGAADGVFAPLRVACLTAYGVAEVLGNTSIYEALRLRSRPPTEATA